MSGIRTSIAEVMELQKELLNHGYTKSEAAELIQTAVMLKMSKCIRENYDNQPYFRMSGSMATYKQ